ncbi:MAG: hypothetical protein WCQ48_08475 [Chloroflexota bacterium]
MLHYIANRKGGVHFDPSRGIPPNSNKRKAAQEVANLLLDHGLLRGGHLSGPEFEVLSMAQALTDTEWCAELIRVAQEIAPAEFGGDPYELKFWTGQKEADGTPWATSRFTSQSHPPKAFDADE